VKPKSATARLEELLAYRFPQSGKQLTTIVLSREDAEEVLRTVVELQQRAEGLMNKILDLQQRIDECIDYGHR
jgi:hypothetical protein